MASMTSYLESTEEKVVTESKNEFDLEDDMFQEAEADSLVEAITGEDQKPSDVITTAEPMESLPPISTPVSDDGNALNTSPSRPENPAPTSTESTPTPNGGSTESVPFDQIVDDVNNQPAPGFENSNSAPLSGDPTPVPDTTPGPDDKDQGDFEGPMKYIPLYQRRNEEEFGLDSFGSDYTGNTPNNQYDMNEVNRLNDLIASEAAAVDEYVEGAKVSKNDNLQRLYSDIASEERFHMEQLLYAKSTITGERYIPRDPDVKEEYRKLLDLGMDEETAMTTAVDKVNLMPQGVTPEDVQDAASDVQLAKEAFDASIKNALLVMEFVSANGISENSPEIVKEAFNEIMNDGVVIQEATGNIHDESKSFNPIKFIINLIKNIYGAIIRFIKKLKVYISKMLTQNQMTWNWIKAHGIKGLFSNGIKLYFYDEKNTRVDTSGLGSLIDLSVNITRRVIENCGVQYSLNYDAAANFGSFTRVKFNTIDEGVTYLKGVPITKTKVVVTDNNEQALEALFFGVSRAKIKNFVKNNKDELIGIKKVSANIFNQYEHVLQHASIWLKACELVLENIEHLEAIPTSVYHSHRSDIYNPCVNAMNTVVKVSQKIVNCLTADVDTCLKLNNSLLEATKKADAAGSGKYIDAEHKDSVTYDATLTGANKVTKIKNKIK